MRGTVGGRRAALALAVGVMVAPAVSAQAPAPPVAAAPTREELEEQLSPGVAPPARADEIGELAEPDAPAVPLDETTTYAFVLRGLEIANATVFGPDRFRRIYEPFLGTEVTIGSLREIANRIEQLYRDEGYVATRVIIPPQAITGGVATLEVFEGRIIHYEINGEIGPVKKQIARLLDNLLTGEPARWSELERYLLLARDLPGISLTGTLRSAGESVPGGVVLVVDAARKPVDGFVSLQNRNAEPTGTFTISGGAALNSNTEYAERLGAVALLALEVPEQVSGYVSYGQSLGNDGLRFELSAIHGYSEPKDALESLRLISNTTVVEAELEYPLVRSRRFSMWTRGGFDFEDQRVSIGRPGRELLDDQLRILYAGTRAVWLPPFGGVTQLDFEVRQGLDDFGASATSKPDASVDFTLVRAEASLRQPVPPFFELFLGARAQKASEPLPALEEMSLGELTIGRGYEPGTLTGDNGVAATAELRYFPPGVNLWWLDSFHLFGFVDWGLIDDVGNPTGNPDDYEDLASAGFGVRFQVFESLYGDFYYAQPLTRALDTADRIPNGGVKFSLTQFF